MTSFFAKLALSTGFILTAQAMCPTGLDPYSSEPSPFGWPLTPSEWQFAHPECWAEKYELCGGHRQSPMDLDLKLTSADCVPKVGGEQGKLAQQANYKIVPGRPVVAISKYMRSAFLAGDFGSLKLKDAAGRDVEYEAVQVHVTAGSLHKINGTAADAELMVVHKPKGATDALKGGVVLSVLFRESPTSSAIFSQMGFAEDANVQDMEVGSIWKAAQSVDLHSAAHAAMQGPSYSYTGSVPVPPCNENVQYIVLAKEQPVGSGQVAMLKELLRKHAGGHHKRPAVERTMPGEICREIKLNSLQAETVEQECAKTSERTAACWAPTCGKSPVNIEAAEVQHSLSEVPASDIIAYKSTNHVTVTPSMYTVDAVGDFGHVLVNGRLFQAKKLSVKAVAQHTFNGTRYAGQLVVEHILYGDEFGMHAAGAPASHGAASGHAGHGKHRRLEEELDEHAPTGPHKVMLTVPLKLGRENALMRSLGLGVEAHKVAIRHGNSYDQHGPVDLAAALEPSTSKTWYWYSGGPTTPGSCPSWGVKWMVFSEPLEVSLEQLNSLALEVSGMDSTMMPKESSSTFITKGYVPEDGVELGNCDQQNADTYGHPSCWKLLHPMCGNGKAQSPINIDTSLVSQVGTDVFLAKTSWKPVSGLRLINNGHSIGFQSNQLGYATVVGSDGFPKYYQVTGVELRMPSEHLIDGKQYPAELQVMHKNQKTVLELEDDDVIVTSFLFEFGEENKLLKQLLPASGLPAAGDHKVIELPVDLMWALGPALDKSFFKYDGSYTTPGCGEAAQWAVFETPLTLSMDQWQAFKAAFPNPSNNRPVQPLNGRTISKNTMEEAEPVEYRFFLNREMGRNKLDTPPGLIVFPIVGTILLCTAVMAATFQREDRRCKDASAGGLEDPQQAATVYGRGYGRL